MTHPVSWNADELRIEASSRVVVAVGINAIAHAELLDTGADRGNCSAPVEPRMVPGLTLRTTCALGGVPTTDACILERDDYVIGGQSGTGTSFM